MKKVWILGIAVALLLAGCTLMPGDENAAVKVVNDFIKDMVAIRGKYGGEWGDENWQKAVEEIRGKLDDYIYFDESLSEQNVQGEGIEGAKDWVAEMIYGHIEMWNATETFTISVDAIIENPTDVPTSLRDDVEAVASMTIASGDATGEAYAVKVKGKWYVEAIGWDDNQIQFYPWGWVPELYVGMESW